MDIGHLSEFLLTPATLQALALVVAGWLALLVLTRISGRQRYTDPQRLYTTVQRRRIFELCGHRCEHKSLLWFRCKSVATHADHVHPHSRGGPTTVENGQGLCEFHNLSKGAHVPTRLYRARLARRRKAYYPPGAPRKVVHRRDAVTVR